MLDTIAQFVKISQLFTGAGAWYWYWRETPIWYSDMVEYLTYGADGLAVFFGTLALLTQLGVLGGPGKPEEPPAEAPPAEGAPEEAVQLI